MFAAIVMALMCVVPLVLLCGDIAFRRPPAPAAPAQGSEG
jgi:hypothetical protein